MGEQRIDNASVGDLQSEFASGTQNFYSVPSEVPEGATGTGKTRWQNTNFYEWYGLYKEIPELAGVIDAKADWTSGNGYDAEPEVIMLLDSIKGNGFDTFTSLLRNAIITMHIGGDSER